PMEAIIEREPITVICSDKGWVRAMKGHIADDSDLKFKEGDEGKFLVRAETTDKILIFASDGRFFTIAADKLPKGRGHGEPLRLMIDLGNEEDIVAILPHRQGQRLLLASTDGRGFIVNSDDVIAQKKAGKQVLNPGSGAKAQVCLPVEGELIAVVGTNRKLLVFETSEVPEMARGKGVILQRYRDGKLGDITFLKAEEGLSWSLQGGRTRTETDLTTWRGKRAGAGKMPPTGFPRPARFT
ncbi:MAG: DNA topoisomerase IV subunit A, partial [Nisaea sp.]|uniref:DNA gyrase C-terminal beta-propeller domain-containing protein n=1 Tax=Nisaea sp. TaxID=2024842 RepID=UPI001B134461